MKAIYFHPIVRNKYCRSIQEQ